MRGDGAKRDEISRRELLAAAGASAAALGAGVGFTTHTAMARGSVFEDRSGSGRRQAGDRGIPGVMVSNGSDVARTAADGSWSLPVADGDSIFVIKPPHWATPLGPGGVPRFSHLHQPSGTPAHPRFRHAGVAPTGALPASIDFPLHRRDEKARFDVLLFSDTQPADAAELAYLRDDVIAGAIGSDAAFGINHGDVLFDDLSLYPRYLRLLGTTGIPWHHCPGNHDINSEAADDHGSRDTWKRVFGARHYALQYAGATFILLDNVHYFGHNPGTPRSGQYCGLIGWRQLQFVRNVLAATPAEHLVVVSMHIPLLNYQDSTNPADNTADRAALLQLLSTRRHAVSFSGHMHTTEHHYLGRAQGFDRSEPHHHHVLTAASGSWWGGPPDHRGMPLADSVDGTPNGSHVLTVDGNLATTRFVAAARKSAEQLRVLIDAPHLRAVRGANGDDKDGGAGGAIPPDTTEQCEIIANVFDGGPRTRVTYEIAGRPERIGMTRARMCDPFVAEVHARHPAACKSWARPVPSSHIWKANLPACLGPGAHCVTVRAWDEYGREHVARTIVEVMPTRCPDFLA